MDEFLFIIRSIGVISERKPSGLHSNSERRRFEDEVCVESKLHGIFIGGNILDRNKISKRRSSDSEWQSAQRPNTYDSGKEQLARQSQQEKQGVERPEDT